MVADYFGVAFLNVMHAIAADRGEAAGLALEAGVDIELPSGDAYLEPLAALVRTAAAVEAIVDRAVLRALKQKEELGLLEPDVYEDAPPASRGPRLARSTVTSPGGSPRSRWCCSRTTACCRCRGTTAGARRRHRARTPTAPRR